ILNSELKKLIANNSSIVVTNHGFPWAAIIAYEQAMDLYTKVAAAPAAKEKKRPDKAIAKHVREFREALKRRDGHDLHLDIHGDELTITIDDKPLEPGV